MRRTSARAEDRGAFRKREQPLRKASAYQSFMTSPPDFQKVEGECVLGVETSPERSAVGRPHPTGDRDCRWAWGRAASCAMLSRIRKPGWPKHSPQGSWKGPTPRDQKCPLCGGPILAGWWSALQEKCCRGRSQLSAWETAVLIPLRPGTCLLRVSGQ